LLLGDHEDRERRPLDQIARLSLIGMHPPDHEQVERMGVRVAEELAAAVTERERLNQRL
jgi:hypothetical protein